MARKIGLSGKTKQLIAKLAQQQSLPPALVMAEREIGQAELLKFLNERPQGDIKNEFLLASLSASLLKDLHDTLLNKQEQRKKKADNWFKKLMYGLLALDGIIFFGCEGFDGIAAMLEVLPLTPTAILATGAVFALLSITVFFAFNFVEIAKNLEIKNKNAPQLLDIYLKEVKLIKMIRKHILSEHFAREDMSVEELRENLNLVKMLQTKQNNLDTARLTIQNLGSRPALQAAKSVTATLAGIIFFSGGFFAGQMVALQVAELCFTAVAATFPPVVFISFLVGAAALRIYWYTERPNVENYIASYVGLDQEKIDLFCGKKIVAKEKEKLRLLECGLKKELRAIEKPKDSSKVVSDKDLIEAIPQVRMLPVANEDIELSGNRYGFHTTSRLKKSVSEGNLLGLIPTLVPPSQGATL